MQFYLIDKQSTGLVWLFESQAWGKVVTQKDGK